MPFPCPASLLLPLPTLRTLLKLRLLRSSSAPAALRLLVAGAARGGAGAAMPVGHPCHSAPLQRGSIIPCASRSPAARSPAGRRAERRHGRRALRAALPVLLRPAAVAPLGGRHRRGAARGARARP